MTTPQIIAFGIIIASLVFFAWGRWRYDIVAMGALVVEKSDFDLITDRDISKESLSSDEVIVVEAVVNPGSRLEGRTAGGLRINSRYGVNILAVARQGKPIRDRIGHIRFQAGDVVLI